jgi:DNA-binding MarR family transcriptional regulator
VEKLVQSGLLDRAEDPNDRRAKQVTLSTKGQDLIEKSIAERFRWVDRMAKNLSAEDMGKVKEALSILTDASTNVDK